MAECYGSMQAKGHVGFCAAIISTWLKVEIYNDP